MKVGGIFLNRCIGRQQLSLNLARRRLYSKVYRPVALSQLRGKGRAPDHGQVGTLLRHLNLPSSHCFTLLDGGRLRVRTLRGRVITYGIARGIPRNFRGLTRFRGLTSPSSRVTRRFTLHSEMLLKHLSKHCAPLRRVSLLVRTVQLAIPHFSLRDVRDFLCAESRVAVVGRVKLTCSSTNRGGGTTRVCCRLLGCIHGRFGRAVASVKILPLILCGCTQMLSLYNHCRRKTTLTGRKQRTYVRCKRCRMLPQYLRVRTRYQRFVNSSRVDGRLCCRSCCLYGIVKCRIKLRVIGGRTGRCLSLALDWMTVS